MVPVHCTCRSQELKIFLTKTLKSLLTGNQKAQIFDIWYVASSGGPSCSNYSPGVKNGPALGLIKLIIRQCLRLEPLN